VGREEQKTETYKKARDSIDLEFKHSEYYFGWDLNSGACACYTSFLPFESHP
jgi:hypothetical protein